MKQNFARHGVRRSSLLSDYCDRMGTAVLRHRASVTLDAAKVDAELASSAKSEFIAKMSHELRTPLNAIIGFSEVLSTFDQQPGEAEKVPEYSRYIEDSARHLLSIVNNILELSKIQSGRATLHIEKVDLEEVLSSSLVLFKETAKANMIEIRKEAWSRLPLIDADLTKIRQIFINLISNAVKFTPSGGRVTITLEPSGPDSVRLIVHDTGIGMSTDDLQIAMQPFGQADGGTNRKFEGTGLGLPIVRALVELHNGSVHIHSEVNKGTTITLSLPVGRAVDAHSNIVHPAEPMLRVDSALPQQH